MIVTFPAFSLQGAADAPKQPKVAAKASSKIPVSTEFTGKDGPRRAVSGDGYDLVYHFPGAVLPSTLVCVHHVSSGASL